MQEMTTKNFCKTVIALVRKKECYELRTVVAALYRMLINLLSWAQVYPPYKDNWAGQG